MKRKHAVAASVLLLTFLLLPFADAAYALQDRSVTLTVEAGYNGYFRSGQWVPLWVSVSNSGPDIIGELRAMSTDIFGGLPDVYAMPIELPTQSSKQVFLYIPLAEPASQIRVELATSSRIVTSETRDVRPVRDSDMLFAIITESPRGGIDLKNIRSGVGEAFQANWRLENLPRLGEALRGLDALVLTDVDTGNLSAEQQQALEAWVLAGGHLVVTGGPNWQKTQAGVTGLLPLQPTGRTTLIALPSLAHFAGQAELRLEAPPGSPIFVAQGELAPDADVLIEESGVPLLARRKLGGGYVDYLAIDPGLEPFQSWADRGQFWFTLLTTSGQRPSWSGGVVDVEEADQAADYIKGLRLPDVLQLTTFLALYTLIIGPLNYLVLRRLGRRELAWVTIPLVVLGTSVIYYFAGFNLRGTQAIINRLAIVQVWPGSERAQVDGVIGVLAPRRAVYDLVVDGGFTLRAITSNALGGFGRAANITIYEGTTYEAHEFLVDAGTTASFTTSGNVVTTPLQGEAVITFSEGLAQPTPTQPNAVTRISGTFTNTTGMTLRNMVVLAIGSAHEIGTVGPGESRTFDMELQATRATTVALGSANWGAGFAPRTMRPTAALADLTIQHIMGRDYTMRRYLAGGRGFENTAEQQELWRRLSFLRSVIADSDPGGGRGTNVYVVGWTEDSPLRVDLKDAPYSTEDTTLYVYQLPVSVSINSNSGIIEVPKAFLTWTPTEESSRRDIAPYEMRLVPGDRIIFRYTPLPLARLEAVTEIRLELIAGNTFSQGKGIVSLWDWQAKAWQSVNTGNFMTQIARDVERFIGPENAVQAMIEVSGTSSNVYFERFDITLFGRLAPARR